MNFLGWRQVPTVPGVLGHKALEKMPCIDAGICQNDRRMWKKDFRLTAGCISCAGHSNSRMNTTYVVSCSSRTIIYKGMFLVGQLRTFFQDLQDPDYDSAIAIVHSRFSTNTNPSWERAHPYRFIVHNGEINTIRGNADKMLAREETHGFRVSGRENMHKVLPVINA